MSARDVAPFLSEPADDDPKLTDAQRLELAEHEWQAWKQIAHEYWLEIQRLRAWLSTYRSETK